VHANCFLSLNANGATKNDLLRFLERLNLFDKIRCWLGAHGFQVPSAISTFPKMPNIVSHTKWAEYIVPKTPDMERLFKSIDIMPSVPKALTTIGILKNMKDNITIVRDDGDEYPIRYTLEERGGWFGPVREKLYVGICTNSREAALSTAYFDASARLFNEVSTTCPFNTVDAGEGYYKVYSLYRLGLECMPNSMMGKLVPPIVQMKMEHFFTVLFELRVYEKCSRPTETADLKREDIERLLHIHCRIKKAINSFSPEPNVQWIQWKREIIQWQMHDIRYMLIMLLNHDIVNDTKKLSVEA
jgi:hypothetical protein